MESERADLVIASCGSTTEVVYCMEASVHRDQRNPPKITIGEARRERWTLFPRPVGGARRGAKPR